MNIVQAAEPATPSSELPSSDTPWRGVIAVGVAALITPIGYLGNEGIAPLVALGGLLTLPWLLRPPRWPPVGVFILAALTAWTVASYVWSPLEPVQTAHLKGYNALQALVAPKLIAQLLLYGAFVAGALGLSPRWRGRALMALAVSTAAVLALLVVEGIDRAALYEELSEMVGQHWRADLAVRNAARGAYAAVVLIWPTTAALQSRGLGGLGVAAMTTGALGAVMLGVDAPVAALLAAAAAYALVRWLGRAGVWTCLGATVVYFLAAPWPFLAGAATQVAVPKDIAKLSWRLRLEVWRFASDRIAERPMLGWGLDSSRAWPDQIPMHPHDAALQLWLETGAVGAALATLFWAWLFVKIDAVELEDRGAAAMMAATAAAYLTIGAISFGVWQEWWLATGAFAIAACAQVVQARRMAERNWGAAELVALGET